VRLLCILRYLYKSGHLIIIIQRFNIRFNVYDTSVYAAEKMMNNSNIIMRTVIKKAL